MTRGYTIIQEELARDRPPHWQFWILVACVLVNCTRGVDARPVLRELRRIASGPWGLAVLPVNRIFNVVSRLGLGYVRTRRLHDLACVYHECERLKAEIVVRDLPGCGRFAEDAWRIFVLGDLSVRPSDKELKAYLESLAT